MAAMVEGCSILNASQEAAFEAFHAKFTKNGFTLTEGLIKLLRNYELKSNETPDKGRVRLYRSLWRLLWFGSNMTLGAMVCGRPTFVFPATLKRVARAIIPGNLAEKPDPTHSTVYKVTIGDLAATKWPAQKTNIHLHR